MAVRKNVWILVVGAFAAVWLVGWLWLLRYHLLDDALIHLRYAHNLWQTGRLTFDGVQGSYGSSSLLYVATLSGLDRLFDEPLVPKAVSLGAYLTLVALAVRALVTDDGRRALWATAGLLLLSPMAMRWLTDGMETSFATLTGVTLAHLARPAPDRSVSQRWVLPLIGAAAVLLRIELLALVASAGAARFLLNNRGSVPFSRRTLGPISLFVGAALAVGAILLLMGHLLPDTAVAKAGQPGHRLTVLPWGCPL